MTNSKLLSCTAAVALTCLIASSLSAQSLELSEAAPTMNENFNAMGTGLTMPTGWKIDRNTTGPTSLCAFSLAADEVNYAGSNRGADPTTSANLPSNAGNGTYNFCSSDDSTDRAVGGITTGVTNGTRAINVMTCITNAEADMAISQLTFSYNIEKYRKGLNASGFAVEVYTSLDGTLWHAAGGDLRTVLTPDNETAGAAVVPIETYTVSNATLDVNVPAGQKIYIAWNITVASGNDCQAAMALAVDDITITASEFTEPIAEEPEAIIALTTASPTYAQNFDSMFDNGTPTLTLPDGWRIDRRLHKDGDNYWLAPYFTASREVMYSGGVSLANNASNGTYNFASAPTSTDRAVGGISTGSGTASGNSTKCVNLMAKLNNGDEQQTINTLTISYDIEKYRNGNNANGFDVQLYTSPDGIEWTSAGADFCTHFEKDSSTGGSAIVPITTVSVENKQLRTRIDKGETLYLAWHIAVGNHVKEASGAQALAIDNVSIEASFVDPGEAVPSEISITPANVVLVPTLPERIKVLSLNNSLIDYNTQYNTFNSIATAMGKAAVWTNHTHLGKTLDYHYTETTCETTSHTARETIASDYWTHIILQEHSSLPRTDLPTFRNSVAKWVEYIRAYCPNPNAIIIMPINWGYDENEWRDFTTQNTQLLNNYTEVARELGVTLCPVAKAYQLYYDDKGGEATHSLYSDNRHPTPAASYMAACMEFATIFGIDPTTITYSPLNNDDTSAEMRLYAKRAIEEFNNPINHPSGTVEFIATVLDQFGAPMATDGITFSASTGSFDGNIFTADPKTLGTVTITAAAGEISATATVEVAEAETPAPLQEALVVHGYLNLNFKSVHLVGETDQANRPMGIGAPYTVTLSPEGTVVYTLDYSAASNIAYAPNPQIWKGNFYNMTNEGNGIWTYTFAETYSPGDKVSFSRYVNGAVDESSAITLTANEPVTLGDPSQLILNISTNAVVTDDPTTFSVTVRDAAGHNLNTYPEVDYTCSDGATISGNILYLDEQGTYSITATMGSMTASANITRYTTAGATNLALNAAVEADEAIKTGNKASKAVDGDRNSLVEWTVAEKNEEHYLTVDLGTLCSVEDVTMVWEGASATVYDVELSANGTEPTHTYEVTNGEGGAGVTAIKHLFNSDFTPTVARYVTVKIHTMYNSGWGLKLKEVEVYGHRIDPVEFILYGVNFHHDADKNVTVTARIEHSNADHVVAYDVWVAERKPEANQPENEPQGAPRKAPVPGTVGINDEYVVGSTTIAVDKNTGSTIDVTIPLTHLTLDDAIHDLAVRAHAIQLDGSTVYATSRNDDDALGDTGNESWHVDTSKSDTVTGIDTPKANTDRNAVYYNLQGIRVANPSNGLYIRRCGSESSMIFTR